MFGKNTPLFLKFGILLLVSFLITGCLLIPHGLLHVTSYPSGAKIYLNGTDSGKITPSLISNLSPGSYQLELILEEPSIVREESVVIFQNQVTTVHIELITRTYYRALCIGVDEYNDPAITNLRAPSYDVDRMKQVFENSRFGKEQAPFTTIDTLIGQQATRSNILQSITSLFSGANSNDISYFYFSGHGYSNGNITSILPYDALWRDSSKDITVDELASALGSIPGTKVVIIDACYSGGFIGKELSLRETLSTDILRPVSYTHLTLPTKRIV